VLVLRRIQVAELAAVLQVNRHTLHRWIEKKDPVPEARQEQIAKHLGFPIEVLFDHDDHEVTR